MSSKRRHPHEIIPEDYRTFMIHSGISDYQVSAHLFQLVYARRGARKRRLSDAFIILPSKEDNPHYHQIIKKPMDLRTVARAIRKMDKKLEEIIEDLKLVFDNAMFYNEMNSQIHKDADALKKIVVSFNQQDIVGHDYDRDPFTTYLLVADLHSDDEDEEVIEEEVSSDSNILPTASPNLFNQVISLIQSRMFKLTGNDLDRARQDLGVFYLQEYNSLNQLRRNFSTFLKDNEILDVNYSLSTEAQMLFADYDRLCNSLANTCNQLIGELKDSPASYPIRHVPDKSTHPDYYEIIENPIDLAMIRYKIQLAGYNHVGEMVEDFKLLIRNTKRYYGLNSLICRDLLILSAALDRIKNEPKPSLRIHAQKSTESVLLSVLRDLTNMTDETDRRLYIPFKTLPSRSQFRDYYDIIPQPIDLKTIKNRISTNYYKLIEEGFRDFKLMFDNALFFNDPRSQIYRDTLLLYRLLVESIAEYYRQVRALPDHQIEIFRILVSIFVETYNLKDLESSFGSSSSNETDYYTNVYDDEFDVLAGGHSIEHKTYMSWDKICKRIFEGYYRRLDSLQDDLLTTLEYGIQFSQSESNMYNNSIRLRKFYFECRDRITNWGKLLWSPALQINSANDSLLLPKQDSLVCRETFISVTYAGITYTAANYIYVKLSTGHRRIMLVHTFFAQADRLFITGRSFYFPGEVFQLCGGSQDISYISQEVFLAEEHPEVPVESIEGHCFVLSMEDFTSGFPQSFNYEDVYVCEYLYDFHKSEIRKVPNWFGIPSNVLIVQRYHSPDFTRFEMKASDFQFMGDKLTIFRRTTGGLRYYSQLNGPSTFGLIRSGYSYLVVINNTEKCLLCEHICLDQYGGIFIDGIVYDLIRNSVPSLGPPSQVVLTQFRHRCPINHVRHRIDIVSLYKFSTSRNTEIPNSRVKICRETHHGDFGLVPLPPDYEPYTNTEFEFNDFFKQDEVFLFAEPLDPSHFPGSTDYTVMYGQFLTMPILFLTNQYSHQLYGRIVHDLMNVVTASPAKRRPGRKIKPVSYDVDETLGTYPTERARMSTSLGDTPRYTTDLAADPRWVCMQPVAPQNRPVHHPYSDVRPPSQAIDPRLCQQVVYPRPPQQSIHPQQVVYPRPPQQPMHTRPPQQVVYPRPPQQMVHPRPSQQMVHPRPPQQVVHPRAPQQPVNPRPPEESAYNPEIRSPPMLSPAVVTMLTNYACRFVKFDDPPVSRISTETIEMYGRFIEVMKTKSKFLSDWDTFLDAGTRSIKIPVDVKKAEAMLNEDLRGFTQQQIVYKLIEFREQLLQDSFDISAQINQMI